jgi:hypothetical protein
LKLYKLKRNRIEIDAPKIAAPFQPGIRPDNDWVQYTPNMSESDLAAHWKKPFTVKPELGFYAYKKVTKLRVVDDRVLSEPDFLNEAYMNFFMDKSKVIYEEVLTIFQMCGKKDLHRVPWTTSYTIVTFFLYFNLKTNKQFLEKNVGHVWFPFRK